MTAEGKRLGRRCARRRDERRRVADDQSVNQSESHSRSALKIRIQRCTNTSSISGFFCFFFFFACPFLQASAERTSLERLRHALDTKEQELEATARGHARSTRQSASWRTSSGASTTSGRSWGGAGRLAVDAELLAPRLTEPSASSSASKRSGRAWLLREALRRTASARKSPRPPPGSWEPMPPAPAAEAGAREQEAAAARGAERVAARAATRRAERGRGGGCAC